jgi:DNA-binding NtrC family response regulator
VVADRDRFDNILGKSSGIRRVFRQIRQISRFNVLVLITGESGTGKDLVARAIHRHSSRSEGPYYPVNMGAIPTDLIASTLFGHEKGAFTGAAEARAGMFESAQGGTLFLDEISTMDELAQVSLLRVIETGKFQRVGGTKFLHSDARIIAATNVDLNRMVREHTFRADLYHRLNVFQISLPPLRRRGKDALLLTREFLRRYSEEFGKDLARISPEAKKLICAYLWPGNVRELENVIMRAVITADGDTLTPNSLKSQVQSSEIQPDSVILEVGTTLEEAEKQLIARTLVEVDGNKGEAARLLGISRKGIYNKVKKYGIEE